MEVKAKPPPKWAQPGSTINLPHAGSGVELGKKTARRVLGHAKFGGVGIFPYACFSSRFNAHKVTDDEAMSMFGIMSENPFKVLHGIKLVDATPFNPVLLLPSSPHQAG